VGGWGVARCGKSTCECDEEARLMQSSRAMQWGALFERLRCASSAQPSQRGKGRGGGQTENLPKLSSVPTSVIPYSHARCPRYDQQATTCDTHLERIRGFWGRNGWQMDQSICVIGRKNATPKSSSSPSLPPGSASRASPPRQREDRSRRVHVHTWLVWNLSGCTSTPRVACMLVMCRRG
jgi:hypothetical protein